MSSIQEKAKNVLLEFPTASEQLPVNIEHIVEKKGIRLLPFDFKEDISGVLMLENGEATIGYNLNEHRLRNRFTIAHELGHYLLHKDDKDLFVDKEFRALFRLNNGDASAKHEREANEFAACILMPEDMIRSEIANSGIDYTDENLIKTLAKKFDVSTIAMSIRISKLGLFEDEDIPF
ncbi:MAG: ImmA/IrrE family metallo-endopeptidase [Verrucomicrobia bacterium]|nr:ImmA/IrrE family metallo-endopeptidase [Verrucomicrobiota bacterium]